MTYQDIVQVQQSSALMMRCTACAASLSIHDPDQFVGNHWWTLAATEGWGEAWAAAVQAQEEGSGWMDHGMRDDVIDDGMILTAVQAALDNDTPA